MPSLLTSTWNTRFIVAQGKPSVTVRSEKIDDCPVSDIAHLRALGVRAVVDLRRLQGETVNPHLSAYGIAYHNVPIDDVDFDLSKFIDETGAGEDDFRRAVAVGDFYFYSFRSLYRRQMLDALKLYNRYDGHILIHCTYGKDRTAMIAYLIQRHLGATEAEMRSDYLASSENLRPLFREKPEKISLEKANAIWDRCFALCGGHDSPLFDEFDRTLKLHTTE